MDNHVFKILRFLRADFTDAYMNRTIKEVTPDCVHHPATVNGFHVDEKEIVILISWFEWEPKQNGQPLPTRKRRTVKRDPASGQVIQRTDGCEP